MSELIGITLEALLKDYYGAGYQSHDERLKIVALEAQRALLREIIYHDYPGQLLDLQDKLGVTE